MPETPTVREDGDMVVIRLPRGDADDLRVGLAPCPCKATKSTATSDIRARLSKALGRLSFMARTRREWKETRR